MMEVRKEQHECKKGCPLSRLNRGGGEGRRMKGHLFVDSTPDDKSYYNSSYSQRYHQDAHLLSGAPLKEKKTLNIH